MKYLTELESAVVCGGDGIDIAPGMNVDMGDVIRSIDSIDGMVDELEAGVADPSDLVRNLIIGGVAVVGGFLCYGIYRWSTKA